MLVLTRKTEQTIVFDNDISITVLEVRGNQVRLAIRAPREVGIRRAELLPTNPRPKEADEPAEPVELAESTKGSDRSKSTSGPQDLAQPRSNQHQAIVVEQDTAGIGAGERLIRVALPSASANPSVPSGKAVRDRRRQTFRNVTPHRPAPAR